MDDPARIDSPSKSNESFGSFKKEKRLG